MCLPDRQFQPDKQLLLAELPEDLPQDSQDKRGVAAADPQSPHPAPDFFVRGRGGTSVGVAGFHQDVLQERRDLLHIGPVRSLKSVAHQRCASVANELKQAHSHSLAKIHGRRIGNRRNPDQRMAKAQIFIRESELFGAKQQGRAALEPPHSRHARFQSVHRMLGNPPLPRGGPDDEGTILQRLSQGFENSGGFQDRRATHGRNGLSERHVVRVDQAQVGDAKIRQGTSRRPYIQRVPCVNQNNCDFGRDVCIVAHRRFGIRTLLALSAQGRPYSVKSKLRVLLAASRANSGV